MAAEFTADIIKIRQSKTTRVKGERINRRELPGDEGVKSIRNLRIVDSSAEKTAGGFFVKKVKTPFKYHEINPVVQQQKWDRLRHLNLPVVNTFRIDPEENVIVMTDVSHNGECQIYDRSRIVKNAERGKIKNLDVLKQEAREVAEKAYDHGNGVFLSLDAYSVVVDKNGTGKLMLLDLGQGSRLLNNGLTEDNKTSFSQQEAIIEANDFVYEVLEGNGSVSFSAFNF